MCCAGAARAGGCVWQAPKVVEGGFTKEMATAHEPVLAQCKIEWDRKMNLDEGDVRVVTEDELVAMEDSLIVLIVLGVINNSYDGGKLISTDWDSVAMVTEKLHEKPGNWIGRIKGSYDVNVKVIKYAIKGEGTLAMGPEVDFKVNGVQKALGSLKYWTSVFWASKTRHFIMHSSRGRFTVTPPAIATTVNRQVQVPPRQDAFRDRF